MAGMPERVGKGPVLRDLDKRYDTDDINLQKARLQALKTAVAGAGDIADHGATVGVLTPGDKQHMKDHWLKKKAAGGWWGEPQVNRILTQGLIAAFETAITDPDTGQDRVKALPIETLWICSGARDSGPFEVFVTWNTRQVTFIIHSPDLPDYGDPVDYHIETMWVVKRIDTGLPLGNLDGPKDGDIPVSPDLPDPGPPPKTYRIVKRRPKMNPNHA